MLPKKQGSLEVICGSMFSGKSEELIKRMRRAIFSKKNVQVFKHSLDQRSSLTSIDSHAGNHLDALSVGNTDNLLELISKDTEIIGIDEIQFFNFDIIEAIHKLINEGRDVIVSGLDLDFRGIPFGPVPYLLAMADSVLKLKAVCSQSGKDAHFTQRLINGRPASFSDPIILIGANNFYEARSREYFEIDHIPLKEYIQGLNQKNI